jgi:hypothetical protein
MAAIVSELEARMYGILALTATCRALHAWDKNKMCWHCKAPSEKLIDCVTCHFAVYCSKSCRAKHKSVHKFICLKQKEIKAMYKVSAYTCKGCQKVFKETIGHCSICEDIAYCSQTCERVNWDRHMHNCMSNILVSAKTTFQMSSIDSADTDPIFKFFDRERQWIRDTDNEMRGQILTETRMALVENLKTQMDQLIEEATKNRSERHERLVSRLRAQVTPEEDKKSEGKESKTEAAASAQNTTGL